LPGKEPGFVLNEHFVITGVYSSYKIDIDLSDYAFYYGSIDSFS